MFGREDSGLSNEELRLCHWHVHVPTSADYSSLNLAAAVQLLCYELRMTALAQQGTLAAPPWDEPLATVEGMERFYEHLDATLTDIGFLNPAAPRLCRASVCALLSAFYYTPKQPPTSHPLPAPFGLPFDCLADPSRPARLDRRPAVHVAHSSEPDPAPITSRCAGALL